MTRLKIRHLTDPQEDLFHIFLMQLQATKDQQHHQDLEGLKPHLTKNSSLELQVQPAVVQVVVEALLLLMHPWDRLLRPWVHQLKKDCHSLKKSPSARAPVQSASPDYMRSLATDCANKMFSLDSMLDIFPLTTLLKV